MKIFSIIFICTLSLFRMPVIAQNAAAPAVLSIKGEVTNPLTLKQEDFSKMKRIDMRLTDRDNKDHDFSGVDLSDILRQAGAPMGPALRGKNMNKYLLVESKDGYLTVFSLAELDSGFISRTILLVDREDGQPLSASQGPFRIVVPGEKKHARWTWGVTTLIVQSARE